MAEAEPADGAVAAWSEALVPLFAAAFADVVCAEEFGPRPPLGAPGGAGSVAAAAALAAGSAAVPSAWELPLSPGRVDASVVALSPGPDCVLSPGACVPAAPARRTLAKGVLSALPAAARPGGAMPAPLREVGVSPGLPVALTAMAVAAVVVEQVLFLALPVLAPARLQPLLHALDGQQVAATVGVELLAGLGMRLGLGLLVALQSLLETLQSLLEAFRSLLEVFWSFLGLLQ